MGIGEAFCSCGAKEPKDKISSFHREGGGQDGP